MARGGASRVRKRVEAESSAASSSSPSLKRAKDGSAFTKCEECEKDVPVALISFHNCSLDAKIKMNLEAQVVEMPGETKKKPLAEKKKSTKQTETKSRREKKGKNPNARKRPPTAFFLFMEEFRKSFKEANPDCKSVATVAKEGGEKWKSMSDEDKKVYTDRAAELRAEYEKGSEPSEAENEQDVNDASEKEANEEEETEKEANEEEEAEKGTNEEEEAVKETMEEETKVDDE